MYVYIWLYASYRAGVFRFWPPASALAEGRGRIHVHHESVAVGQRFRRHSLAQGLFV